jgi:hypothetical protein
MHSAYGNWLQCDGCGFCAITVVLGVCCCAGAGRADSTSAAKPAAANLIMAASLRFSKYLPKFRRMPLSCDALARHRDQRERERLRADREGCGFPGTYHPAGKRASVKDFGKTPFWRLQNRVPRFNSGRGLHFQFAPARGSAGGKAGLTCTPRRRSSAMCNTLSSFGSGGT